MGDLYHSSTFNGRLEGRKTNGQVRLNDLWELSLTRPDIQSILQSAKFKVRKQRYLEMVYEEARPSVAIRYVQQQISEVVNREDPVQADEFYGLPQYMMRQSVSLVGPRISRSTESSSDSSSSTLLEMRKALFQTLLNFFPDEAQQPKKNITDFVL